MMHEKPTILDNIILFTVILLAIIASVTLAKSGILGLFTAFGACR